MGETDTLLFVDVDGVLNVVVRDLNGNPLALVESSVAKAKHILSADRSRATGTWVERIDAACTKPLGHGENCTYEKFVSDSGTSVSSVFLQRFAALLKLAGERRTVILASTWRRPEHAGAVARLENAITAHLGEPFKFDGRVGLASSTNQKEDRVKIIGDSIHEYCVARQPSNIRALVLEDFQMRPVGTWAFCEDKFSTIKQVEHYLESRAPSNVQISVKLVHTYDHWMTADGLSMQIGAGLTLEHYCKAQSFLGGRCQYCETRVAREEESQVSTNWRGLCILKLFSFRRREKNAPDET